jgi:hypothetical protein
MQAMRQAREQSELIRRGDRWIEAQIAEKCGFDIRKFRTARAA